MAVHRTKPLDPNRLFHATVVPLCLLDDEARIAYLNPAFESFCHCSAAELLGIRCHFHAPANATRAQLVAAAIAPPHEVLGGAPLTRHTELPAISGEPQQCAATYLSLGGTSEDASMLLVVLKDLELVEAAGQTRVDLAEEFHVELQRFRARNAGRYRLDLSAGSSPAARRLRAQLDVAAASSAHVVITGAAGSGRRSAARAIHLGQAPQQRGPLALLDAPVATLDVLKSALAALTRGGPYDPVEGRAALLVADIEELALELQAELWRFLRGTASNVRVLATATRSLIESARSGHFHVELAHALTTIEIPLVTLAERRDDIPLLAQALLEDANGRATRQHTGFSPEALDLLAAYAWPKGIAELAEIVELAHRRAEDSIISSRDLDDRVRLGHLARRHEIEPIVLDRFMTEIEQEVISRALRMAKGNKARAARLLGLTRPRLYRRMEQLGLHDEGPTA